MPSLTPKRRELMKKAIKKNMVAFLVGVQHGGAVPAPAPRSAPLRKSHGEARVTRDEQDKRPFAMARIVKGMTFGDWSGADRERRSFEKRAFYKGMIETNDSSGGYLVPPDVNTEVIENLKADSIGRNIGMRIVPMSRMTAEWPKLTGASTTSWGAEATTLTEQTSPTLGQIRLVAKKLFCRFPVSNDLIMDASPQIESLIRTDMAEELGLAEDSAYFLGSGIGDVPLGLVNVAGVTEVSSVVLASLAEAELRALRLAVRNNQARNLRWCMTPQLWDAIEQLENGAGNRLVHTSLMSEGPARLLGQPVTENTELASGVYEYIFCGQWNQAIIGQRMSLEIATSPHVNFNSDETMIRGILRVDFALRNAGAFAFCAVDVS